MASRQLRRLAGDKPLADAPEEVDNEDIVPVKSAKPGAFALLDAEDDEGPSSGPAAGEGKKKRKKKNSKKAADTIPAPTPAAAAKPAPLAAVRGEDKKSEAAKPAVSEKRRGKKGEDDDEDIDALVAQLDGKARAVANAPATAAASVSRLFALDTRYLSLTFELRQNFGTSAVRKPAARGLRRCWFVRPQESWPRVCGIGMELVSAEDGINTWRFVWSPAYAAIQEAFEQMVATNDPHLLQQLVRQHQFHVDACLQLSELAKATGEYETAAQLIERCIYAYETAMPSQFDPGAGNNRINFGERSNRGFFLALFRQLQIAGRQSCNFTAYAIARFLLSLDPSDPLFIILIVDYYALRCKDFAFIFRLAKEFVSPAALLSLPNLNISLALARFHQEKEDKNSPGPASAELLLDALMRFPVVLLPLLKRAGVSISPLGSDGKKVDVTAHPFFLDAHTSPSLQHLVSLYVERSYALWKSPETLHWLELAVSALLALIEKKDPLLAAAAAAVKSAYNDENNKYHNLEMDQAVATVIPANLLAAHDDLPAVRPPPRVRATTNNPLALFFSSLLPWNPVPNAPAEGGDARWLAEALAAVGIGEREVEAALRGAQGEDDEDEWEEHPHQQ